MIKYMAVAVAVAVSEGVAVPVAVPVAVSVVGLTQRFFNQKDFLINVWGYQKSYETNLRFFFRKIFAFFKNFSFVSFFRKVFQK